MNHEDAFLQAILENPEDDASRLIYADWLEEQGYPARSARGELIRVHDALRDLPADDPRRLQLEERQRELLEGHEAEWVAPLRELGLQGGWVFRRGFVERVTLTPPEYQ